MRALISLIIAACFVACPAFAAESKKAAPKAAVKKKVAHSASKKKGKFKIRVLSYAQIARLPKAKRMKYMRDIRELLISMEAYQQKYEVASNPYLEKLKEQVAWMMNNASFLPEAKAEITQLSSQQAEAYRLYAEGRARADREARYRSLSKIFPVFNGNEWVCGQGLRFDKWAGTCYLENLSGTTTFSDAGVPNGEVCPTELGFHDVAHIEATANGGSSWIQRQRACVPNGSWNKLTPARQAAVEKGERLPGSLFSGEYTQAQADAAAGSTSVTADVTGGAVTTDAVVVDTKAAPQGTDDLTGGDVTGASTLAVDTAAVDTATTDAAKTCEPEGLACLKLSEEEKVKAIARFRSNGRTDDAICVYGGFLSKYTGGVKKPGGCDPIKKLPYFERFGEHQPKCSAGRSLCNPVAFCLAATQNGKDVPTFFCVDIKTNSNRNAPITDTCNTEYARMLRGEPFKDKNGKVYADQIVEGLKGIVPKQCDGLAMKDLPFQAEWDKIKADTETLLNNWCTNKNPDQQALFCNECNILTQKLAAANANAGASNCDPAAAPVEGVTPDEPVVPPVQDGLGVPESTDDIG